MKHQIQNPAKEPDHQLRVRQILGECQMSGAAVTHRNDMALGLIIETLKTDGVHQALEVAKQLTELHPNFVDMLARLYAIIKNEHGSSHMGKGIAFIYSKTKRVQMDSLIETFRTPPLHTTNWMLKRVGEMVDQTAGVVRATQLGLLKYKPVLLLSDTQDLSNSAFLPYLDDVFEIIYEPREAQAFLAQPLVPKLDTYMMHFSNDIFGHSSEYEAPLSTLLYQNGLPSRAFDLKDSTISVAQNFLQKFDLKHDDLFVTLHVREEGYVDHSTHIERNADPHLYQNSIDHLIKQGIKVVRIGHPKMTPLKEQNGFIDLTRIERPDEVDLFLCARNWFYFGTSSGPFSIAFQFGRPSLLIDFLPYGTARPNCFHLAKSFCENQKSKVLSFHQLKEMDLDTVFSSDVYKKRGLHAIAATQDDIKNAVLDMLEIGPEDVLVRNVMPEKLKNICIVNDSNVLFSRRSVDI
jgi:putative glycosyltransferase (TIGR04372 family)